jgi:SNF2 family DNA or RNA helicase
MEECQRKGYSGTRRSRRTVSKPVTYNDDEDIEDYKKMSNRQRRKAVKGWINDEDVGAVESSDDEPIVDNNAVKDELDDLNGNEHIVYTRKKTIDDFNVEDYEDRIDDWIDHGISSMKAMSEQHESDERPGAVTFLGGLDIPKWINDRLFGYQRTALRWLWELHLQEAGGIVGTFHFWQMKAHIKHIDFFITSHFFL